MLTHARIARLTILASIFAAALLVAPAANAAIPSVLGGSATCTVAGDGVRECSGKVNTFDGVPIDVNVAFPPVPASGPDGNYPLLMTFHGYGGSKLSFANLRRWTDQGYASFTMSDRGFGDSCGSATSRAANPAGCSTGWVRLLDTRYEVRDAQDFAGMLADEGLINPQKIGAQGGSYGGGLSMALASLKNRKMMPDGSLVPWTSPNGTPMQIAAATPEIPWTDLAYSLAPNGRTLDYVTDSPYFGPNGDNPIGIIKQSFVALLFGAGAGLGYYAPPGVDPEADLTSWYVTVNAGEPYGASAKSIIDKLIATHSSYYIPDTVDPAPLLISNGWTDDLFPPDESIRFYNRTRAKHPNTPIDLMFLDYGHMRGTNKPADTDVLKARENAWLAHYVLGTGPTPDPGVETLTTTCPKTSASGGPYFGTNWATISPGEIRYDSAEEKTVASVVPSDINVAGNFDPLTGSGACATAPGSDQMGAATYRLAKAPASGFTLMGSPTVVAKINSTNANNQLAARLLDVDLTGTETLVGRALYRPDLNSTNKQVFQLHPNGYHFAEGHIAKLELLPSDTPYGRISNGQQPIKVSDLELRLPVIENPGALGGIVKPPAPPVVPDGYTLVPEFKGKSVKACTGGKRMKGTATANKLFGTPRGDRIRGRGGNDTINPKSGRDCVGGGPGDDHINTVDGKRDVVRCGVGKDTVKADKQDKLVGCESVKRAKQKK